jgi:protein-tyrosine phosphatase
VTTYSNVHEVHRNLFLGAQPADADDLNGQFEAVLDLSHDTTEAQKVAYEGAGIVYRAWPMHDGEVPPISEGSLDDQVLWIQSRLEEDRRVLVHCAAGASRSATIAALFLMRVEGLGADAAVRRLHSLRPVVRPNSRYLAQLRLLGRASR